ncbi:hypothetical protein SBA7_880013 [Candidatus Sulfotelmatobacter sp. SbA7]|nr:hypothetical protein SBA7_880013 [Candidatus Sulfotelmatobacter sp. SbA7]
MPNARTRCRATNVWSGARRVRCPDWVLRTWRWLAAVSCAGIECVKSHTPRMARLEPVFFGVRGKERVKRLYDRSQLKLGSRVYVRFSDQGDASDFSPSQIAESIPHWVRWIATSEWYAELVPRFELRPEFAERIYKELEGYLGRTDIDAAVAKFVGMVRMERFYLTDELGGNPLSVVFTIIDRLNVCKSLGEHSPYPEMIRSKLDDPLVTYLYLTCFDRLGQPADWLDFGAWMESSKHKSERDGIVQRLQSQGLEDGTRSLHREYNSVYGVRSSFFRFLRSLPPKTHRELLDSIDRDVSTYLPNLSGRQATDEEKEKYLFRRRNDYTHKADFRPPPGEWFGGGIASPVQEFTAKNWTSTQTRGWPDILEKTVRIGLAQYLSAAI